MAMKALRREQDCYNTPDALALAICQRLGKYVVPAHVVEPSAGSGAFVRAARATWPGVSVDAIEPNEPQALVEECRRPGVMSAKPVTRWRERWEDWDHELAPLTVVLGNPPFSLAEAHIRLALQRLPDQTGYLCLLLRGSILASQGRVRGLWREHPPRFVWHVAPRPSFTEGGTDMAEYVVVTWAKGWHGDYAGSWLEWKR